jgi:hypothetical protein
MQSYSLMSMFTVSNLTSIKTALDAVNQAKDKGYIDSYGNLAVHFHIMRINFDSNKRQIDDMIWKEV